MINARDAKMYALECATSDDRLYKTILESVAKGELYCTKEYISEGIKCSTTTLKDAIK